MIPHAGVSSGLFFLDPIGANLSGAASTSSSPTPYKDEVARRFDLIRELNHRGLGSVFVSHFLEHAYRICDRVTILRNDRLVAVNPLKRMSRIDLVFAMAGKERRAITERHSPSTKSSTDAPALLEAKDLASRGRLPPASLSIHRGATVGTAGLLGSGRTEFAELLFDVHRPDSATISMDSRQRRFGSDDSIRR